MDKICYIMGKSSSGKDTVFQQLQKKMPQLRLVVPYTTRPIRVGEKEGVEYHFVDEKKLEELEKAGKVIELRSYNTKLGIWRYFTADDGQIDLSGNDYLVIGTLEGYEKMRQYFGENVLLPIYIEVEDGTRLHRALGREDRQQEPKYAEMCRRFLADEADFSEENIKKAGIEKRFSNEELSECLQEIILYLKEKL
ncbi:MAG: guanylate kinase [Hespellia sp.]|nr:guanylate kinase [Hespellia sp.]